MLNVVLPWIATLAIILIVAVACRFAEEGPGSDDPPDSGGEDRLPVLLAG